MDNLLVPSEEKRHLANACLSYVPTNKSIINTPENKLKLLLAENSSDSTKRFFIACGGRQDYLQNESTIF